MESFKWRGMNHRDLSLFCYCILMLVLNISAITCRTGYTPKDTETCYKFYNRSIRPSAEKTQVAAQSTCEGDSANLAAVKSDADGRFYRDLMVGDSISEAWIGAYVPTYGEWQYISDLSVGFYQGCFSYDSSNTDFSFSFNSADMTRTTCAARCGSNNKLYAAVFDGNECMCADTITRGIQYSGTDQPCAKPCTGNSSETCGGERNQNHHADILRVGGEWMIPVAAGQPNNNNGQESCYVIDQYDKQLYDHNCNRNAHYICQDNNGFTFSNTKASWFDARMDCVNNGGDLAKISNVAEWVSLFGQLRSYELYYFGLINRIWRLQGQEGSSITYSKWATGKPEGMKEKSCAYLDREFKWQDAPCNSINSRKYFFCEHGEISTPATTTMTSTSTTAATTTTAAAAATTTATAASTNATAATTASTTKTGSGTTTTGTTASTTTAATTATTAATTATTAATTTTAGTNGGGDTGAATGGSSTLSTAEIILIVVCCIFLILIIILIIVLCYYKRKNTRKNKISGYQDTRDEAHIPYSGSIGDEIYLPASESGSNSSQSNLIRGGVPPRKPKGYEPSPRPASITVDERY